MPGKPQPVRIYSAATRHRPRAGAALATTAIGDLVSGIHPRDRESSNDRANLEQRITNKALAFIDRNLLTQLVTSYRHYHPSGDLLYVGVFVNAVSSNADT